MRVAESKVSYKNLIHIPTTIRIALDLQAGDKLEWHAEGKRVYVRKKKG